MTLTIEQQLQNNGELIFSKDTQVMDDLLSTAHLFFRKHPKESDEQEFGLLLREIEEFYHFEEMSDFKGYNGALKRATDSDPLIEDVYYGHAYIPDGSVEKATEYFFDRIIIVLDGLAPQGFYFGTTEGNSSEYGFYKSA